jgi:hypothetical protein
VGVCAIDAPALRADADRSARLARTLDELAAGTRMMKKLPYDFRGDLFRKALRELAANSTSATRLEPLGPLE